MIHFLEFLWPATFRQNLLSRLEPAERSYGDYYGGYRRDYRQADQYGSYSDWDRSGGCCNCGGYGGGGGQSSLLSDGTLFALLAGAALAFYILYTTVTMAAAARRRKKRGLGGEKEEEEEDSLEWEDLLWQGRLYSIVVSLTLPLVNKEDIQCKISGFCVSSPTKG